MTKDRFGLSWRGELATGILANRARIDAVELIADDHLDAPTTKLRHFRALAREIPLSLHSIHLGLASTVPVSSAYLDKLARVADVIDPASFSDHLAFVRAGDTEIGHMHAPIRDEATLDSTLVNLARAERITGRKPEVENIATLIDPPGCAMTESEWLAKLLQQCENALLLDIHNVHANATNFGYSAEAFLDAMPLDRVHTVHIAGGKWIGDDNGNRRYLDDHLNPVNDPTYALLETLAAKAPNPLTVILERDGRYPAMRELLDELDRARAAVARGRERRERS